jgi:hypothetical protein
LLRVILYNHVNAMKCSREISHSNLELVFSVSETASPSSRVGVIYIVRNGQRQAAWIVMTDRLTPPHRSLGGARGNSRDRTVHHMCNLRTRSWSMICYGAVEVHSLLMTGPRDFSVLHSAQTGPGTHPASSPMATGGRGVKLTTHHHLEPRSRIVELYLHSPVRLHGVVHNNLSTRTNLGAGIAHSV